MRETMKYLNVLTILSLLMITKISFACDDKDYAKNEISVWLGDNSLFSKAYKDGNVF